jgi:hypothetical protein
MPVVKEMLRGSSGRRVRLVTSWFHLPRAYFLTRLYSFGSGIEWDYASAEPNPPAWLVEALRLARPRSGRRIAPRGQVGAFQILGEPGAGGAGGGGHRELAEAGRDAEEIAAFKGRRSGGDVGPVGGLVTVRSPLRLIPRRAAFITNCWSAPDTRGVWSGAAGRAGA